MTLLSYTLKRSHALLRFAVAGVFMNMTGYLLYVALTSVSFSPKLAMSVTYFGGTALNFALSRQWVFRKHDAGWGSAIAYGFVYLCGYGMNYIILWVLVDKYALNHLIVQALSIGVVATFIFMALRFFVFRERSPRRAIQ